MDDEYDDDLFADVYAEEAPAQSSNTNHVTEVQESSKPSAGPDTYNISTIMDAHGSADTMQAAGQAAIDHYGNESYGVGNGHGGFEVHEEHEDDGYGSIGIKEDGKMFIGGLNWETTDESLRDYFSQFGEVTDCTVMRDSATGRSRGFGFLTFRDPKVVNTVMVKEHFLDGKIIDPKRAIPREEQERTAKIFVGGVSPEATEQDFKNFFTQFGRVIDATLMMDKDTGRPRGFGFVTFDGDEAVDRALSRPLEIRGKAIEVKRAQPRSTLQAQAQEDKKFGRQQGTAGFNRSGSEGGFDQQGGGMQGGGAAMGGAGITPAVMAKYWHNMQQYFKMMQQQMTTGGGQQPPMGMGNPMAAGGMNPMMAGMMAMAGGAAPGGGQMPGAPAGMMDQAMQQQMMNQQVQGAGYDEQTQMSGGSQDFNGQAQNNVDREKYERREAQRMQQQQFQAQQASYGQAGPTSWEGMYDDIPQPNMGQGGGGGGGSQRGGYGRGGYGRGGRQQNTPPQQPPNAPLNAPTGPKNAGRPGANYRGGGRGGHRGYHPYSR